MPVSQNFIRESADLYVRNTKKVKRIEIYKKIFPIVFSSLVTLLLSIFSVLGQEISYTIGIFIGSLIFGMFILGIFSVAAILVDHSRLFYGVRLIKCYGSSEDCLNRILKPEYRIPARSRKGKVIEEGPVDRFTYYVLLQPLYDLSYREGIKKTTMDFVDMMFVILLPGGLFDIVYGVLISQAGPESTLRDVVIGIVLTTVSLLSLTASIIRKRDEVALDFESKSDLIRNRLEEGYRQLQVMDEYVVDFPPIEA
jgi:hypothetical protein